MQTEKDYQGEDITYGYFREAFEIHYDALCNYAFTFLKSREASEDIVQETFIRIWEKHRDILHKKGECKLYLYVAVRNNCFTYLKKEGRMIQVEWDGEDLADEAPTEKKPEDGFNGDLGVLIAEGIALLPERCREVFTLSRSGNLTYQQIADTMHISIKTVENQMGKALKVLRAFMKEKGVPLAILIFLGFF